MQDLLNRIVHVKRLVVVSIGVAWLSTVVDHTPALSALRGFVWAETAAGLFGAALAILIDAQMSRDKDAADDERFRRIIREEAPEMRRAVIEGFAFEPSELARVATPAMIVRLKIMRLPINSAGRTSFACRSGAPAFPRTAFSRSLPTHAERIQGVPA